MTEPILKQIAEKRYAPLLGDLDQPLTEYSALSFQRYEPRLVFAICEASSGAYLYSQNIAVPVIENTDFLNLTIKMQLITCQNF